MNTKNRVIKVVFLLRKNSPLTLKQMEYFVDTGNYTVANKKAVEQLKTDLEPIAERVKESVNSLLRYYDNVAMSEVNLIR